MPDMVSAALFGERGADAPAVPGGRPSMPVDCAELYDDWLTPNGINGWLPAPAVIVVDGGQVTYPSWRHTDGSVGGWSKDVAIAWDEWTKEQREAPGARDDPAGMAALVEPVTVPLAVPVTDRVRELFTSVGLVLVER